jgi:hypothetical protein
MKRRSFLLGVAGLLVPTTAIFLPPRGGWPDKYGYSLAFEYGIICDQFWPPTWIDIGPAELLGPDGVLHGMIETVRLEFKHEG